MYQVVEIKDENLLAEASFADGPLQYTLAISLGNDSVHIGKYDGDDGSLFIKIGDQLFELKKAK